MLEVICNDRLGKKVRVKCNEDDTIGDLKKVRRLIHLFELPSQENFNHSFFLSHSNCALTYYCFCFHLCIYMLQLIAAQVGTRPEKIRLQKWYTIFKDHVTLEDYEIHDGMGIELYYN